jgi:RimJ/RimL family protein N-acetyltransferase
MTVRVLTNDDLAALVAVVLKSPVENLFIGSRVKSAGLDPFTLGCEVWGFERDGEIVALCHHGSNLVLANADAEAIDAFAQRIGPRSGTASIMGPAEPTLALWRRLRELWPRGWGAYRELRPDQPLMVLRNPSDVAPDPRVREITFDDFDAYFRAAVAMYTEEVGVSPIAAGSDYRYYVQRLIRERLAFGIVERGEVVFKADVGASTSMFAQVQGVWVKPSHRGKGLSAPAMTAVDVLLSRRFRSVSLYVNSFNLPARALYRRVGYVEVGTFATILF